MMEIVMMEIVPFSVLTVFAVAVYAACRMHGLPEMISELYYREENGWIYPVLLAAVGCTMLPLMLESGGWQWAAFVTCAAMVFVGAAPAYAEEGDRGVHKGAAITAASAGVVWCVSAGALLTVAAAALCACVAVLAMCAKKGEGYARRHWLFAAEVAAMAAVAVASF